MTIQQLKYIIALDEHRHFARAAEECMVTQPGLTIQLKNLEEEIGIKIFDRSSVPLKPTPDGKEIIARARKILFEAEGIREYVVHKKNDLKGRVTIGVISTLSPYLMPAFIKAIKEKAPDMHFTIKENNTGMLMHELETGAIDIALMATPTGQAGLREYPVFYEPFVACLPEKHPMAGMTEYVLQPQDRPELLLLQHEYCYNAQLLDICDLPQKGNLQEQFSYEINAIETLKHLVRAGLGFAIVPQLSVGAGEGTERYKPFKEPVPVREISLVVNEHYSRKLLLDVISKTLWDCLPESIKKDKPYKKIRWNDSPYFIEAVSKYK